MLSLGRSHAVRVTRAEQRVLDALRQLASPRLSLVPQVGDGVGECAAHVHLDVEIGVVGAKRVGELDGEPAHPY